MSDVDDGDYMSLVVDSVDDAVGAAPGAVPIAQRRVWAFADPVRAVGQRPDDELMGGEGDSGWQDLGKLAPRGRGYDQLEWSQA